MATLSTPGGNEETPTLHNLCMELKSIINWQGLGARLGIEMSQLETIASDCQGDVDLSKTKMYKLWLSQCSNVTWREVVDALYLMKEDALAENIQRKYLKPSAAFPKNFADLPHHIRKPLRLKVLRKNYSFLYHHLKYIELIPLMPEGFEDATEKMINIGSYEAMFAQRAVVINTLLRSDIDLKEMCVALETIPGQKHIAEQLIQDCKRELSTYQSSSSSVGDIASMTHSDLSVLSEEFLTLLKDVIDDVDHQPNALKKLKQSLELLTLPFLDDEIISLVEPSSYQESKTTQELFSQLSPHFNCLNVDLLHLIFELCRFDQAAEKVVNYQATLRTTNNSSLVLCIQDPQQSLGSANDGASSVHSASIIDLQSTHPSVFARLPEHKAVADRLDAVRLSVEVDAPLLRLSDYEDKLMALSGFFEVPKAALTYIGCSERPLVLCWLISYEVYEYIKHSIGGVSGEVLLAQQGIVSIAIGEDVRYTCSTIAESQLYEGAHYNLLERVQELVKSGVNVDKQTYHGFTALCRASCDGHQSVVEYLIKAGAKLDLQTFEGATPMTMACQQKHEGNVQALVQAGATLDIQTSDGTTALCMASQEGLEKTVQLLIQAGANLDLPGKDGATALYMASQNGHEKVVQLLLQAGASLDTQCDDGTTALMPACNGGNEKVVDCLLKAGAQPNIQDNVTLNTPLLWATKCRVEQVNIVRRLLEHGADVNIKNKKLETALDVAEAKGYTEVSQLIKNVLL